MQTNRLLASQYPSVNNSEKYLKVFYRKSKSERTNTTMHRMLKKFSVHTVEQMAFFEVIFDLAHNGFLSRLKQLHISLTATERIILAFIKVNLPVNDICRNLGYSDEEVKRTLFCISKKLQISLMELSTVVNTI